MNAKRAAVALVLGGMLGFGMVPAVAAPADAAAPNIVTKAEFAKIKKGDPIAKVQRLGGHGKMVMKGYGYMSRDYKVKGKYGFVNVAYNRVGGQWVVDSKYGFWL